MTFVDAPPGTQTRFGLLEAASVVTGPESHSLLGVEFEPVCGTAHLTVGACQPAEVIHGEGGDIEVGKTVDTGWPFAEGLPFAVYHLFACAPVGSDVGARARASFEMSEGVAVEEWFGAYLTGHTAAVDITPVGGAVAPADGLALLEGYAGANYGGAPVIHGDRGLASLLLTTGQLNVNGGRLETGLGSRFAAGGGYLDTLGDPGGGVTSDDEGWLYATGPVGFWRGGILDANTGVDLTTEVIIGAAANPRTGGSAGNVTTVLIERPYVGGTSCLIVGVKVNRTICCSEAVPPT